MTGLLTLTNHLKTTVRLDKKREGESVERYKEHFSNLMDDAIEMQEHARKKYSATLSITECINISQVHELEISINNVNDNLQKLIKSLNKKQ
jgi:hypothetical protein